MIRHAAQRPLVAWAFRPTRVQSCSLVGSCHFLHPPAGTLSDQTAWWHGSVATLCCVQAAPRQRSSAGIRPTLPPQSPRLHRLNAWRRSDRLDGLESLPGPLTENGPKLSGEWSRRAASCVETDHPSPLPQRPLNYAPASPASPARPAILPLRKTVEARIPAASGLAWLTGAQQDWNRPIDDCPASPPPQWEDGLE